MRRLATRQLTGANAQNTLRCSFERAAGDGAPGARVLRVGVYAATFGVNFPDKAAACAAAGVTVQTVPGLAAASASGAGHVDLRCGPALRCMCALAI